MGTASTSSSSSSVRMTAVPDVPSLPAMFLVKRPTWPTGLRITSFPAEVLLAQAALPEEGRGRPTLRTRPAPRPAPRPRPRAVVPPPRPRAVVPRPCAPLNSANRAR